jgi:LmbE family N-acetylglucosaminyl deacetylase
MVKWILGILLLLLVALPMGFLLLLYVYLNDFGLAVNPAFFAEGKPAKAMVVFPHPDDEITLAGTIATLKARGAEVGMVYFTRGEAGRTGGLVPKETLGETRTKEVTRVAELLGADYLEVFDFPDGGLDTVSVQAATDTLLALIDRYQPTILFTFDEQVGLYGHPDHRATARIVRTVCEVNAHRPDFPVTTVYGVTLSRGMLGAALKLSGTFARRYPKDPEKGLPPPDYAVSIGQYGSLKRQALYAHQTQWEVLNDVQPYQHLFPAWLYYRILGREYFFTFWEKT